MNPARFIDPAVCGRILALAGPLILSMTGMLVMQFVDGIFLSWHSPEAVAALGPSGIAAFLLCCLFSGASTYTGTLVAQYHGAGRPGRIAPTTWQGIHFSLAAGVVVAVASTAAPLIFGHLGHAPLVQRYEEVYFRIMCLGAPFALLGSTLAGFFIGRGDTRTPMVAQVSAIAINAVLAYALIFGRFGMPAWGVAGAALATVLSQGIGTVILAACFLSPANRREYDVWGARRLDLDLMRRLLRFGLPAGFRFSVEIATWMLFLFFVGRIGTLELASTSIAWRINGLAFFPIVGLSEAVRTLVGQAQGRCRPDESWRITWQGLLLAECWMVFAAVLFVVFPEELYGLFKGPDGADSFPAMAATGAVLLRFVAVYCLLDAFNIVLQGALQAAGDTRWTLVVSAGLHTLFLGALLAADRFRIGLYGEWTLATIFVMGLGLVWFVRFRNGAWRHIRVIERDEGSACAPLDL